MFSIGKTNDKMDIIDATFHGNMARYLNHSCDVIIDFIYSQTARQGPSM